MNKQVRYYEDYVKRMEHEIAVLKRLGEEESASFRGDLKGGSPANVGTQL
jgi:hypothetical protein